MDGLWEKTSGGGEKSKEALTLRSPAIGPGVSKGEGGSA